MYSVEDPVRMLYENMKRLPQEQNWLCDIRKVADLYSIDIDEEEVGQLSKEVFKTKIKSAVHEYVHEYATTCGYGGDGLHTIRKLFPLVICLL